MSTQAQRAWDRGRARAGSVPRIARRLIEGKKINLIIAAARAGGGQRVERVPRRGCPVGTKKRKNGRFGVGAGLRGQIPDRPPILKGSVGPSKAPLAYRPTSSLPNPPGQVKKKEKGRFGVGAELRGQILDRPPILRGSVGPSKAPLAYRPTSSLPNPPGQVSAFKEFVLRRPSGHRAGCACAFADVAATECEHRGGAPVRTLRYAREW